MYMLARARPRPIRDTKAKLRHYSILPRFSLPRCRPLVIAIAIAIAIVMNGGSNSNSNSNSNLVGLTMPRSKADLNLFRWRIEVNKPYNPTRATTDMYIYTRYGVPILG